ncbi:MAG: hypothetical protein WCI92_00360 [Bacteroidota bacterium]
MQFEDSIEAIKEALIKACIKSRPSYFKPYLFSEKVTCEPDKEGFYKFFKYMLAASKKKSDGELFLKIKFLYPDNRTVAHYEFYDTKHIHARLTIIVEESNQSIYLDVLPF